MDNQQLSNIPTNLVPDPTVVTSMPNIPGPIQSESNRSKLSPLTIILGLVAIIGIITTIISVSQIISLNQKINDLETELSSTQSALNNATVSYLEIPKLGIRFQYPIGVTDIQYSEQNTYDGTITFTSITKDGITIDINTCGGKSAYRQNTFSLGQIVRLDPLNNNSTFDYNNSEQIARIGEYEFFFNPSSECLSDSDSTDYKIAIATIQELISSIEEY